LKSLPALVLLVAAPLAAQTGPNPHNTPADREAGAKIFRTHCAPCHGVKGTGGTGPDLTTGRFFHGSADADLYRNISEGIPNTAMPDVFFDGAQVWQIVAFVRSLSRQPAEAVKGDLAHGRLLIETKGCMTCHLIRGQGDAKGPDLSVIGSQRAPDFLRESIVDPSARIAPEYRVARISLQDNVRHTGFLLNQDTYMVQILDFAKGLTSISRSSIKDFTVDSVSWMPSYQDSITGADLNDIVAYLSSLRRDKGATE
jgi:putative heme-binding domain-containing protein